jgi:hypothetical protein
VHYSAGSYCAFVGAHYLWRFFHQPRRDWKSLALLAAPCVVLLATWFGWSLAHYGAGQTLASNTTVTSSRKYAGSNVVKIAANVWDSLVPVVLRDPSPLDANQQQSTAGLVRDDSFMVYQHNLILGMGVVGGPLAVWLFVSGFRRRKAPAPVPKTRIRGQAVKRPPAALAPRRLPEWPFWRLMVPFCVLVGIAVVGERDPVGVAHLTLLALQMLGLTLLAARFRSLSRTAALVLVAGCVFDFPSGYVSTRGLKARRIVPARPSSPPWPLTAGSSFPASGFPRRIPSTPTPTGS